MWSLESGLFGREMTYLNEDDELPFENEYLTQQAEVSWLFVLSFAFGCMAILNIRVTSASQTFYEWNAIRLILPGIQFIMLMDCVTLGIDRALTDQAVASQWAIAMYMLKATVAPGIFLSTFVITFLAYRNRSIPFCMVHRAPGRNTIHLTGNHAARESDDLENGEGTDGPIQPLIRPATMVAIMRLFALFCFILSLIVNFDVVWNRPDLAGQTGWVTVIKEDWNESGANWHIFLSLLPITLVGLCCFYFAILLWRYGSSFSMKIYPSFLNPWVSPIFGTLCLLTGQCFGPNLFPVLSRSGIWLYQLCFLRVIYEVRHDIQQAGDLGHFLDAIGDDQITGSKGIKEITASEHSTPFGRGRGAGSPSLPSIK